MAASSALSAETITISDDETEVQFLSSTVTNRFGGESLCERAYINERFNEESITLNNYDNNYIERRGKQEIKRNGFQYETESLIKACEEYRNEFSDESNTGEESDADSIEEIVGDNADVQIRQKWTPNVLITPSEEFDELRIDEYELSTGLDAEQSNGSCLLFTTIPIRPSDSYRKAFYFTKTFLKRLTVLDCKDVNLELHLWPAISKNISVACISGPKTGKTTSYLVPLMNWFDTPEEKEQRDDTKIGAIVLCSSTRQTYLIAQLAKLWREPNVSQTDHTIRIVSLNTSNESKQMSNILNGCDILVTTPEPLLRGIKNSLIDCTHTKALIIDEADLSLSLHRETIRNIYLSYAAMKKTIKPYISNGVVYNPMAFQTMIFAEKWTQDVKWFIKEVQHLPTIVFGSHYEASIAFKTQCKVLVIDSEDVRESTVRSIVKQVINSAKKRPRIGIVCRDVHEIDYLSRQLKSDKIDIISVTHKMPFFDLDKKRTVWNNRGGIIFINEEAIKIIDGFQLCDCVIHYKLPKNFDNAFGERFRLMRRLMKSFRNPMEVDVKIDRKLKTFIVINRNEKNVWKVFEYLTRLGERVPFEFNSVYAERPLCHRFASYANCPFESTFCAQRHSFTASDQPLPHLPRNGQIKIVISYVKGTNEFYFRLTAFRNERHSSGQWEKVEPNYDAVKEELNLFKDTPLNTIKEISKDSVYGIAVRGQVLRVQVTEVRAGEGYKSYEKYDPNDKPEIVELYAIDFGHKFTSQMRQLFELPEHLKSLQPFAYKAYLFGIRPLDNEIDWDSRSSQRFLDLVENFRVVELTAWVLKQVNGLFWVNRLHVAKRLSSARLKVDSNPIRYLIENQYVAQNEHKLPNANTDFNRIINIWHNYRLTSSAYHSCLVDDSTYVVVSDFVSIDHFYVIQEDRVTRLQRLEDKWSESLDSLEPLVEVAVDQICFYKYTDCQYGDTALNRAKVLAIDGDKVDVFLLDHGECVKKADKSCLYRIQEKHLKELPFQAIKVSLCGVRPTKPISYELICQLTRDQHDHYRMCIADKVGYADGVHKIRLYVADNQFETHYTCLSALLVEAECAQYIDGEEDQELTLVVAKETDDIDQQNYEYLEDLEYQMLDNMSKNVLGQMGLSLDQIEREYSEARNQAIASAPNTQPIGDSSESKTTPNSAEPDAVSEIIPAKSDVSKASVPQVNGHCRPDPKVESRASKTLRRLRAIEANKAKQQAEEDSDEETEDKPVRSRPPVEYTPGEYDYEPAWSQPVWFDPSDHMDDTCDYTDEEGALEEEDLS